MINVVWKICWMKQVDIQVIQEKLCFFNIHLSLAYISLQEIFKALYANASVQSLLLAGHIGQFLYNQLQHSACEGAVAR